MTPRPTSLAAPNLWSEPTAARLPAAFLPALTPVRNRADVRVHPEGDAVWVCWSAGRAEVVRCLLPVPGVVFLTRRGGAWFRFGSLLPTSDTPPTDDGRLLASVLVPAPFESVLPPPEPEQRVLLKIVRGGEPQPATAVVCSITELAKWADTATTAELAVVRGARCANRAVLVGLRLPAVPGAIRYRGDDLLVPVGFRPDPDLPPAALRAAVGATAGELVLLDEDGAELIPRSAFESLTRASLRLALRGQP